MDGTESAEPHDVAVEHGAFDVGSAIGSISSSPDKRFLAVGGRDVFKILSLDLNSPDRIFALSKNLRGKSSNLNSSTNDVKWHPKVDNLVCTAAMNGAVVVWLIDNANSTRQDRIFNDHERTVNRVSWHPTEAALVLSGSQDGTMKLFDCRGKGCVASFLGKSSTVPVRDVQFSPFYTHNFVSAFDSGVVQLWDSRRASSAVSATTQAASTGPSRSWVAHQGLVLGLDWHPSDRNILATCSRDRAVKVWEMNDMNAVDESPSVGAQQNWRPKATIQTIASVGRIAWRSGGPSRRQQIGSAAALMDTKLQIWDIHRPFVPHASCLGHKDVVTSFMWCRDGDAVITGGKDGRVLLHHVSNAYHPLQHLRTCALAIDVRGQVALSFDPINRVNVDNMSPFVTNATAPASASAATMPAVPPALSDVMSTLIAEFTGAERRVPKSSPAKQLASPAKVAPAAPAPHSAHAGSAALMSAEPPAACVSLAESRPIPVRHASKPAWQWPEEELFVHFARHLQFEGAALRDICEHNASVCEQADRVDLAQMWRLLREFYQPTARNVTPAAHVLDSHSATYDSNQTANLAASLQTLNEVLELVPDALPLRRHLSNSSTATAATVRPAVAASTDSPLALWPASRPLTGTSRAPALPQSAPQSAPQSTTTTPAASASAEPDGANVSTLDWIKSDFRTEIVADALERYADRGDVQTCVLVMLALGSRLKVPALRARLWFHSYVELLQRHRLCTQATEIIRRAPDEAVRSMNQKMTTVHQSCAHCHAAMLQPGFVCAKCKRTVSPCSLCGQRVQGIWAWCQGCGHGGHLDHMQAWFAENQTCPTGCLHQCTLQLASME